VRFIPILIATVLLASCNPLNAVETTTHTGPIGYCDGGKRHTCIVNGDTIWLEGEKLRPQGFDTPEPQTNMCGGASEKKLALKVKARLRELLNNNTWTVERFGLDRYERTLATIRINGEDVGDILIRERLARKWPDGHEWWCN